MIHNLARQITSSIIDCIDQILYWMTLGNYTCDGKPCGEACTFTDVDGSTRWTGVCDGIGRCSHPLNNPDCSGMKRKICTFWYDHLSTTT